MAIEEEPSSPCHPTREAVFSPRRSTREFRVAQSSSDVLQGTLDLLILKTLSLEPMHGWGVSQRIQQLSRDALQVGQGSLYPALYRLEAKGWISATWGTSENNRAAKFYQLTPEGRRALASETTSWRKVSSAIELVLETA
jgi:transcriptional regulator